MVWAFGYSRETGTTGRTGIRSFDKRHMLFGPAHFSLMVGDQLQRGWLPRFRYAPSPKEWNELFSYMHLISSRREAEEEWDESSHIRYALTILGNSQFSRSCMQWRWAIAQLPADDRPTTVLTGFTIDAGCWHSP
jgi:hypothetical protein